MPLPALAVSKGVPRRVDVLVVGIDESGLRGVPDAQHAAYVKRFGMSIAEMAESVGAEPAAGSRRTLPAAGDGPRIVVVGMGPGGDPTQEDLRRAAGVGVRRAASMASGAISVAVALGSSSAAEASAVAEGALLGSYRFTPISSAPPATGSIETITVVHTGSIRGVDVVGAAQTLVRAVVQARDWVNTPANLLYPESFAARAAELVKGSTISVEILDEKALSRGGYGGLLAVGGGSVRPPRLVRFSYAPRGAKAHLSLVGKGITFDTGGLNLKPADGMYTMKSDMSGAAAVLAATHAIAESGLKIKITAYAALAENMPSGGAYRPSDVLTQYGGKTVENGNSDAEGRLVMADALARAGEDQPDLIIDVATLTGACVIALGDRTGGLMTNDDDLAERVLDAADTAGEALWHLPIPNEIRPKLDSEVADLRSVSKDRFGGASVAAAFLREFVPEGIPWAHLDIAGPAFFDGKPYGYVNPGGTGFGVRTLVAVARTLAG